MTHEALQIVAFRSQLSELLAPLFFQTICLQCSRLVIADLNHTFMVEHRVGSTILVWGVRAQVSSIIESTAGGGERALREVSGAFLVGGMDLAAREGGDGRHFELLRRY